MADGEELMTRETYDIEGFRERWDLEPDAAHPGVALREELEKLEAPFEPEHLDELLYVADETNLLGDMEGVQVDDAITIWRIVELARHGNPELLAGIRM
jgi:hypothetical protein